MAFSARGGNTVYDILKMSDEAPIEILKTNRPPLCRSPLNIPGIAPNKKSQPLPRNKMWVAECNFSFMYTVTVSLSLLVGCSIASLSTLLHFFGALRLRWIPPSATTENIKELTPLFRAGLGANEADHVF